MSRQFIEIITCDRCGHHAHIEPRETQGWTIIVINRSDKEQHFCQACKEEFDKWYRGEV